MRIQDIDFPSDPNCTLPSGFRKMITSALQRASTNEIAEEVLGEQLKFILKKFKAIPAERQADAEAIALQAERKAAKLNPVVEEPEQDEASGD